LKEVQSRRIGVLLVVAAIGTGIVTRCESTVNNFDPAMSGATNNYNNLRIL